MIKVQVSILILLVFIFNGCSQKEKIITKIEYIKEDKYNFNKIDLQGSYIELKDKETQKQCTPSLLELNNIYKGVVDYYDWQIDNYIDTNDTK